MYNMLNALLVGTLVLISVIGVSSVHAEKTNSTASLTQAIIHSQNDNLIEYFQNLSELCTTLKPVKEISDRCIDMFAAFNVSVYDILQSHAYDMALNPINMTAAIQDSQGIDNSMPLILEFMHPPAERSSD